MRLELTRVGLLVEFDSEKSVKSICSTAMPAYGKYMELYKEFLLRVYCVNKSFQIIIKQDHLCFLPVLGPPQFLSDAG